MWFPKTTLSWTNFTIDDFHLRTWLKTSIFFFNYKATWTTQAIPTIGTWGFHLESILKTRFRTLSRFCDRHGPWKDWYGPWKGRRHGQRKRRWEPRGETSTANERLRFVELLKGVLFDATVGVSTGVAASWRTRPVGVRNVLTLSTFCFQFICLRMPPLSFGIVSVKISLFVLLLHFFGICLFVLTVGVHPQLKNCILLGGSSHLVNG